MRIPASEAEDISGEVFGKYVSGVVYMGMDYSDLDMTRGGFGPPKFGAIPGPRHKDRRPWRGRLVEWWRMRKGPRK